ncbi:hypothetical protein Aple_046700 [Acrocarpospora pleiomorpha]|uniref:DUF6286 domain-containing protein n=3 Tax=Acrocarpospora pleiomorpha TaxID=90975 RepID=A0A5M3XKJ1_9ACTN|nr:hypothetical protein Aple_046700 [Acrocarpospora pleiomorpha]
MLTGYVANNPASPLHDRAKWRVIRPRADASVYPCMTMSTVEEILAGGHSTASRARRRMLARQATRRLRPGRDSAGVVVAAALAIVAWGSTAEMVVSWLGGPAAWPGMSHLVARSWGDALVPGLALAAITAGVVLILLAVLPGRVKLIALETADEGVTIGLTRQGLRRTLASAALTVDGVDVARVRLRHGQIEVTVVTDADRTGDLLREVGAAVGDRLQSLALHGRHEVVVRLRRRRI